MSKKRKNSAYKPEQRSGKAVTQSVGFKKSSPNDATRPMLDRFADWLNRQARAVRILIAAVLTAGLVLSLAVLMFRVLFNLPPNQFSPETTQNLGTLLIGVFGVGGIGLYWVGWRLLVGFDFGETPLRVGRAGVLWVLFCLGVFALMLVVAFFWVAEASQPS
jgi:hypothetical protein